VPIIRYIIDAHKCVLVKRGKVIYKLYKCVLVKRGKVMKTTFLHHRLNLNGLEKCIFLNGIKTSKG
jgi:hypothetical protein